MQELSRTSPLSVYLMSLLYCYPGAILSALVQAQPPLLLLTRPTQLASFSLVWYLTFYSPLHRVTSSPSLALLLSLAQDWMRLREFTSSNHDMTEPLVLRPRPQCCQHRSGSVPRRLAVCRHPGHPLIQRVCGGQVC